MNVKEIKEEDIDLAAQVLVTAFRQEPIMKYIFGTREHYARHAHWLFATWVRWSVMYGKAWMSTDNNAVVLMRSLEHSGMSLWTMIRAGMLPTPFKLGWAAFRRFYIEVVSLLDKKHLEIMGNTPHWYGWMIGATEPGKGMGSTLLQHCFEIADESGLPIYLETATKDNIALYGAKEFELRDRATVSESCTIYFMVRKPQQFAKPQRIKQHEPESISR